MHWRRMPVDTAPKLTIEKDALREKQAQPVAERRCVHHEHNKDERVGECGICGGPTPYCLKCDVCYCAWCEN